MENRERNEKILQLTCEFIENLNFEIENAFVEDVVGDGVENQVLVSLTVGNPAGLIGFRGRNLASIQLILGLMVKNKLGEWIKILLDVNNYRNEQKERLTSMATNLAQKAIATGKPVVMASMSPFERRLCHMALQTIEGITSDSEGEGEERHIVIKPKL
ncbi:hypothetical protein KBC75_05040 [Candidatus Shapirobacteria bacterium]|nr:hypothetical protein [Candidatus Shapirobacteria bacterium]